MPDIHWGYGFPIGGVAATDARIGVISPGGVGYDINCGVRLARTNLHYEDVTPKIDRLADALFNAIPAGVGSEGAIPRLSVEELRQRVREGAQWALRHGYASQEDLDHTEEGGRLPMAQPEKVSEQAYQRGRKQLGTLGSGNHFLEVSRVDQIYQPRVAAALGLELGQVTLMIHSGSRGLGHQTCDDYLRIMGPAMANMKLSSPTANSRPCRSPLQRAELSGRDGGGRELRVVQSSNHDASCDERLHGGARDESTRTRPYAHL